MLFEVEKGFKRPKHIENNVFIIYMPNRTKLRPEEDVEIRMKIGISILKDIIYTVTLLPLFKKMGLKLVYYEFMTNSTAAEDTPRKFKIKLTNIDLLKTFDLKKRQQICWFMTLNERDEQFKIVYI